MAMAIIDDPTANIAVWHGIVVAVCGNSALKSLYAPFYYRLRSFIFIFIEILFDKMVMCNRVQGPTTNIYRNIYYPNAYSLRAPGQNAERAVSLRHWLMN
jgi:hypothetical protein